MTTANDLIVQALKQSGVLGVGQSASAEDTNDALKLLNIMIAQWRRKRWLVWNLLSTTVTSTGAQSYTVGPSMDFDLTRPDRLEDAYMTLINPGGENQVDYTLEIIQAREDYDRIALKNLVSWPSYCFYDSGFPTGNVYFWPVPQAAQFDLHIVTKTVIDQIDTPATTINMPPEYEGAVLYNLSCRLRPAYQLPAEPQLIGLAEDSLNILRNDNAQVPRLTIPSSMKRAGLYNIYSDRLY